MKIGCIGWWEHSSVIATTRTSPLDSGLRRNDDWGAGLTIWDAVFIVMASWEACSATRFLRGTAWRSLSFCQVRIRKAVPYEARGSGGQAPALQFLIGH